MLQPTPQLLLRPATSVAASLRLLTHPKLPLTPAESRSLLNALTTSFRHELAQEHGETSVKAGAIKSISQTKPTRDAKTQNGTHTERHLSGILTNPLFRSTPTSDLSSAKDPMDVFDQACAQGLMTYSRARACLIAKKSSMRATREAMHAGDSGAKVLNWLLSTGAKEHTNWLMPLAETSDDFKTKPDIIFEFVIHEGREQVLWDLFEHHVANRTKNVDLGLLLYHISRTLARRLDTLDAAYNSLIKAKGILLEHGFSERIFQRVSKSATTALLSVTMFSKRLLVEGHRGTDALYEDFCRKVEANVDLSDLLTYRLDLHHPSRPDTRRALKHLKNMAADLGTRQSLQRGELFFALDTARVLLEQEKYDDAKWVMDFLQKHSGPELGVNIQNTYEKVERRALRAQREESNLALLDSLGLGLKTT